MKQIIHLHFVVLVQLALVVQAFQLNEQQLIGIVSVADEVQQLVVMLVEVNQQKSIEHVEQIQSYMIEIQQTTHEHFVQHEHQIKHQHFHDHDKQ